MSLRLNGHISLVGSKRHIVKGMYTPYVSIGKFRKKFLKKQKMEVIFVVANC